MGRRSEGRRGELRKLRNVKVWSWIIYVDIDGFIVYFYTEVVRKIEFVKGAWGIGVRY